MKYFLLNIYNLRLCYFRKKIKWKKGSVWREYKLKSCSKIVKLNINIGKAKLKRLITLGKHLRVFYYILLSNMHIYVLGSYPATNNDEQETLEYQEHTNEKKKRWPLHQTKNAFVCIKWKTKPIWISDYNFSSLFHYSL